MRGPLLALLCLTASPAIAAGPVSSHHLIQAAAGPIAYTAIVEQQVLGDAASHSSATVTTTAYLRDGDDPARPVVFAFNGGPGASSSPTQFDGMGPRLRSGNGFADSRQTFLDLADLVFIDPAGTGFSRVLSGNGGAFFSVDGDARATADVIHAWLRDHHRTTSPVYIAGESYGGARIAAMLPLIRDLPLEGLLLLSPSLRLDDDGGDIAAITALPSMAVAARARRQPPASNAELADIVEQARSFAFGSYANALLQGSAIPNGEARTIGHRMAALVGLPDATVLASHLRMDTETYRATLLRDRSLVVGSLDSRVVAPVPPPRPDRPTAASDPALGLGHGNIIVSQPIGRYFHDELHVPGSQDYLSLNLDVNVHWSWPPINGWTPPADLVGNIAQAMRDHAHMRLLVVGGYYDLSVPLLEPRYLLDRAWLPRSRVTYAAIATGHGVFGDEAGRDSMHELAVSFIHLP